MRYYIHCKWYCYIHYNHNNKCTEFNTLYHYEIHYRNLNPTASVKALRDDSKIKLYPTLKSPTSPPCPYPRTLGSSDKRANTVEALWTDTLVSGQLYLRPPWQNPVWTLIQTLYLHILISGHSRKRPRTLSRDTIWTLTLFLSSHNEQI